MNFHPQVEIVKSHRNCWRALSCRLGQRFGTDCVARMSQRGRATGTPPWRHAGVPRISRRVWLRRELARLSGAPLIRATGSSPPDPLPTVLPQAVELYEAASPHPPCIGSCISRHGCARANKKPGALTAAELGHTSLEYLFVPESCFICQELFAASLGGPSRR
jgi:hypothetical protein